ncbi:hypothetical protein SEVIR_2G398050v4 [Setaria viridis]
MGQGQRQGKAEPASNPVLRLCNVTILHLRKKKKTLLFLPNRQATPPSSGRPHAQGTEAKSRVLPFAPRRPPRRAWHAGPALFWTHVPGRDRHVWARVKPVGEAVRPFSPPSSSVLYE